MTSTMKKKEVVDWMNSHFYSTLAMITEKIFKDKRNIPTDELQQYMTPPVWRALSAEVITHTKL